jgi:hypothetical protein
MLVCKIIFSLIIALSLFNYFFRNKSFFLFFSFVAPFSSDYSSSLCISLTSFLSIYSSLFLSLWLLSLFTKFVVLYCYQFILFSWLTFLSSIFYNDFFSIEFIFSYFLFLKNIFFFKGLCYCYCLALKKSISAFLWPRHRGHQQAGQVRQYQLHRPCRHRPSNNYLVFSNRAFTKNK